MHKYPTIEVKNRTWHFNWPEHHRTATIFIPAKYLHMSQEQFLQITNGANPCKINKEIRKKVMPVLRYVSLIQDETNNNYSWYINTKQLIKMNVLSGAPIPYGEKQLTIVVDDNAEVIINGKQVVEMINGGKKVFVMKN